MDTGQLGLAVVAGATLLMDVALAASADDCAELPRVVVREVRIPVPPASATPIAVEVPSNQGLFVVTVRRTGVDAVAQVSGQAPLLLRSPTPLDARDTFFIEHAAAVTFQLLLKPIEVRGPGATVSIRVERLSIPADLEPAVLHSFRALARGYELYQSQIRLEDDAAVATLKALGSRMASVSTPAARASANWQAADAEFVKASDALRPCLARATPAGELRALSAEIVTARAALATLKLESWEAAMRLSRRAEDESLALGLAATATRMQLLRASALTDGATEAKRSNEVARQDEANRAFEQATALLNTARAIFRQAGRLADEAYVENYLGAANHYAGSWDQALLHYAASDRLYARTPKSFRHAVVKQNMALLASDRGDYVEAARLFDEAASMIQDAPQPDMLATILENHGLTLSILGRQDEAIAAYSAALGIRRVQADQPGLARSMLGTGVALMRAGDVRAALPFIEQAWTLRSANRERDRRGWMVTGLARAELLRVRGDLSAASQTLDQVQPAAVSPAQRARFAIHRAKVLLDLSDHAGALAQYEAVLALDLPQINPNVTFARVGRLRTLIELHDFNAARREVAADRNLALLQADSLPAIEAQFLVAELEARLGNRAAALAAVDRAIAATRRIRSVSLSAESRARFMASRREQDELRICLFAGCAGAPVGRSEAMESLLASEDARATTLAELVAGSTDRRQRNSRADVARSEWLGEIDAKLARVDALSDRPVANAREIATLRRSVLELQARLRDLDAAAPHVPTHVARSQVEQLLARLPPDTTVLEFFLGRRTALAWTIDRRGVSVREIASGSAAVAALRNDIRALAEATAADPTLPQRLTRLSRQLIGPNVDTKGIKRLVIVPDGELSFIPFAALTIGKASPLVDQLEVVLTPSLAQLSLSPVAAQTAGVVLIVADPVFDAYDTRMPRSIPIQIATHADSRGLPRLPATNNEAQAVKELLADRRQTVLIGPAATRDNVLKTFTEPVSVAHFASHAVVRASDPSLSHLALSSYDAAWKRVPARLYSSDIIAAGMRADLVVLSACRSAVGEVVAGEGPLGLSYSFLANGSGAVVAATWPVPDTFAAQFMHDFYDALNRDPGAPAAALRTAQLQARKSMLWSSPYYWAAFSLTTFRL
jgi:CHAT domain-containing protein/tetratricopeptide (TPR) repeat protein